MAVAILSGDMAFTRGILFHANREWVEFGVDRNDWESKTYVQTPTLIHVLVYGSSKKEKKEQGAGAGGGRGWKIFPRLIKGAE